MQATEGATRSYQRRRPKKPGSVIKLVSKTSNVDRANLENIPNQPAATTTNSPERGALKRKLHKDKDEPKKREPKVRRTLTFLEENPDEVALTTCEKCGMVYLAAEEPPSKVNRKVATASMHSRYCSGVVKKSNTTINFTVKHKARKFSC